MRFPGDGPWELPIAGLEVLHMTFSYGIDIVAYGDGGVTSAIRLSGTFDLTEPDAGVLHLDVNEQSWADLVPLFALRHDRITRARATKDASLRVEFRSGRV